ncbi:MAG TPA: N-acetylmuramoyl-L-alanine amidase [Terriglobales bacterium]|nr:N-acetylmuramoyl-L-alanine amidase [Terriglobales bacterium]
MKKRSIRVVTDSSDQSNRTTVLRRGFGNWHCSAILLALVAVLAVPGFSATVQQKKQIARGQFEKAKELREELNGKPIRERTKRDYQKVMDAFRRVYYVAATSNRADAAVVAVAELLAEQGRTFKDEKSLHDAIGQYEFLRREYPGSKYRVDALFTIGQIYREDLNDNANAKLTFDDFLKHYPNSDNAGDARQALRDIDEEAEAAESSKKQAAQSAKNSKTEKNRLTASKRENNSHPPLEAEQKLTVVAENQNDQTSEAGHHTGRRVLVTGVRHWSTPDYTRVAVDLEDGVEYTSERIDHPDRIYFDLKDTRLASVLVGKSFEVGDGFLKKIRVAQFRPEETRIVLEVDDSYDYSSFLLPNPSRLIIDIHGRKPTQLQAKAAEPPVADGVMKKPAAAAPVSEDAGKEAATLSPKLALTPAVSESTVTKVTPAKVVIDAPAGAAQVKRSGDVHPSERDRLNLEKETARKVTALSGGAASSKSTAELPTRIVVDDNDAPEPAKLSGSIKPAKPLLTAGVTTSNLNDSLLSDAPTSKPARSRSRRAAADMPSVREAKPTMDGDRSLIRALGLKIGRIVVDAGHGGHDTGTIGPDGVREKDVVLDVALRLGKLLQSRMGADVVYTRDDDTFVPLETRTAIANQQQADLFISIHANSSRDAAARGVETYYLNFTSSRDALEVAARENAVSDKSIHELQDLVKKIALKDKIEESREFAVDVQQSLYSGLAPSRNSSLRDRGVKKAPFIVLIGANMPSILAEISFISNPGDEHRLETPEYRQKIAESLYRGVAKYVNGLSGVKVAAKLPDKAAQ